MTTDATPDAGAPGMSRDSGDPLAAALRAVPASPLPREKANARSQARGASA
jgi:hypothetical protein